MQLKCFFGQKKQNENLVLFQLFMCLIYHQCLNEKIIYCDRKRFFS